MILNEKVNVKDRLTSKLALWFTVGAAAWLSVTYLLTLGVLQMYETVTTFPIWIAGIAAIFGSLMSVAKIITSRTWKGRVLGFLFIAINFTVIAMSAFSIALSYVNFMG